MTDVSVLDHGAVGDGDASDTAAVQRAIDVVAAAGGGRVVVPTGRSFRCGSLELRSGVDLHLERGAVLLGSIDGADYQPCFSVGALSAGVVSDSTVATSALIRAVGAHDIAISGAGTIDCRGHLFALGPDPDHDDILLMPRDRPFGVFLVGCTRVDIHDVTLADSALWTLRLTGCTDVDVRGVRIRSDLRVPNSDGIDVDRCRRVRISDCDILCGDDGISLKTCDEYPQYGPCEDVVITGCVISSRSSGIVVGVDVSDTIRRVVASSCVIRDTHRGLSVSAGTGGDITDVVFADMVVGTRLYSPAWWGGAEPILVRAAPWHDRAGSISRIRFHDILAEGEAGAVVFAAAPGLVRDVRLDRVRLRVRETGEYPRRFDLRPWSAGGGPYRRAPDEPVDGILVQDAEDVVIDDCTVEWAESVPRGAAVAGCRAHGLSVDGTRAVSAARTDTGRVGVVDPDRAPIGPEA